MANYRYLIVGGGMAADAAVQGIREVDPHGTIGVVSDDLHPPYNRPPLSKGLWKGQRLETIWRRSVNHEAIAHLGREAVALDPHNKTVTDDRGTVYRYQKLLLATGGTPRRMPVADPEVIYFRTLDDYNRLRALAEHGGRFVVLGGGFIGSEIAAALSMLGKRVTMVFPNECIGSRVFPHDLAAFVTRTYREKGVEVLSGDVAAEIQSRGSSLVLATQSGKSIAADGIVAGIGIEPNVSLAVRAGLAVDNGIAVDASLRTGHPDVYAAGDAASFYCPALERRVRVEHEDNANTMGLLAGRAMAGEQVVYDHLPFFYSDLFELGYEAVGDLDPRLETVADWKEPHREGVVYYLREGRVRGVLLWNVWNQVEAARGLIASHDIFRPNDLKERLPV